MTTKVTYIAITGNHAMLLTSKHPRAELLRELNATHAEKIYCDDADGISHHIGYTINQQWYALYKVSGRGPK